MIKVGITGGIGSGKSEAKDIFKKYGAFVVDADEIVKALLKKNGEAFKQVVDEFGKEILDNDLEIDKSKLSSIVFGDALKRRKLEEILHPLVIKKREEIFAKMQKKVSEKDIVVAEAALIFEANTKKYFDYVILIKAPKDLRIKRLLSKGFSLSEVEKRMKAQWEDEKKEKLADFVIENNSSLEELEKKVANVIEEIRKG